MINSRSCIQPMKLDKFLHKLKRTHNTSASSRNVFTSKFTEKDIDVARLYCSNLIQKFDSPSFTLQTFIPTTSRDAYLSIRALNVELARIPELISSPKIGALRMEFWRDNINKIFEGIPPKGPVAILLSNAISSLHLQHAGIQTGMIKAWCLKIINAREKYMDNRPYTNMEALEDYAENTYSNILYITLAALPVNSLTVDHIASHIGKANGIAAVLKGLPLIAFPSNSNHYINSAKSILESGGKFNGSREAVVLPLDVMTKIGLKEEDVYRLGSNAPGLKDAVFTVATRANDHLITAKEMLNRARLGQDVGHDYLHAHNEGHSYSVSNPTPRTVANLIEKSFGVFMPAIATKIWLEKLEKFEFDIFNPKLRIQDWRLPWKAYWAYSKRTI
ncbi:putative squalene phytoene synthase protein [Erysiphe necator]|uniref:Putative squalene phytoene synthase protein n=1 Tax=Uncinula necator TaxID=52586 RepID=A0A0B1PF65_UNCNE|nr:putative squalene phytoene synthase protein [Erysiphe necator]